MSKRLLVTSTDLMMIQFLVPHVIYLSQNGYEVEIACSDVGGRMDEVRQKLEGNVKEIHEVRLVRSPANPKNILGYEDMKKVIEKGNYDIVWTNEPVMSVVTRLAARKARKRGTKVLYMVHGFHFYKGAPKKYWMVFYPVEKIMARFCDGIVTMNQEDYECAKKFRTEAYHIPGVGVDVNRFLRYSDPSCEKLAKDIRVQKRQELKIENDEYVLLSVGELTERKNQEVIVRALGKMKDFKIKYLICGKGNLLEHLKKVAKECGVEERVEFLGYRKDIPEICVAADCFVFPSRQEGLPFALMEAMAAGLPIVCSSIRGNSDLIQDGKGGYLSDFQDVSRFETGIIKIRNSNPAKMIQYNRRIIENYGIDKAKVNVLNILQCL